MATYLTLNSKFTPYTYEEILKPYLDRLKALEDKLAALEETSAKASLWEGILNPEADAAYYNSFTQFKSRLEELSGKLSAGDASAVTKLELSKLKLEYNKQFVPLELKYAELKQAQEELRKAALQAAVSGKNIMFTKDMQGVSLTSAMADSTWNLYGTIDLDDIQEKAIAKGSTYGKNAAFYSVFGDKYGNTTPEEKSSLLNTIIEELTPTSVTDWKQKQLIADIITTSFNLGSSDSFAKEISEIQRANTANNINWRTLALEQSSLDATHMATYGYYVRYGKDGIPRYYNNKGEELTSKEIKEVTERIQIQKSGSTLSSEYLPNDPEAGNFYYKEHSDGTREYFKDNKGNSPVELIDNEYVPLGKNMYYSYKQKKVFKKNTDGVLVQDKKRSESYYTKEKVEKRAIYTNNLGITEDFKNKMTSLDKAIEEGHKLEIYSGDQLNNDELLSAETKTELNRRMKNTGFDPTDLIIVYRKDRTLDSRKEIIILVRPEEYNNVSNLNMEDKFKDYKFYKEVKDYIAKNTPTSVPLEISLSNNGIIHTDSIPGDL